LQQNYFAEDLKLADQSNVIVLNRMLTEYAIQVLFEQISKVE